MASPLQAAADALAGQLEHLTCADDRADEASQPDDAPAALLSLPRDVLAIIVSGLDRSAARMLASTSTASLRAVLEGQQGLHAFTVARGLRRCVSRMSGPSDVQQRSVLRVECRVPGSSASKVCKLFAPARSMARLCSGLLEACGPWTSMAAWDEIPAAALAGVTDLEWPADPSPLIQPRKRANFALPPTMLSLRRVHVPGSTLQRLPPDMAALSDLDLSRCEQLQPGCIPASSAASLRVLRASDSSLCDLPELPGTASLLEVHVDGCKSLSLLWLPTSIGRAVVELRAYASNLQQLPEDMAALKTLHVDACPKLAAGWLRLSSCRSVTELSAAASSIVTVPPGMVALERLTLDRCDSLAAPEQWLPATSSAAIVILSIVGYTQQKLPAGMQALADVDVSDSLLLAADWLPKSSAARIKRLVCDDSNLQRIPEYMPALEEVSVLRCYALATDWCPDSVRAHLKTMRPHVSEDTSEESSDGGSDMFDSDDSFDYEYQDYMDRHAYTGYGSDSCDYSDYDSDYY